MLSRIVLVIFFFWPRHENVAGALVIAGTFLLDNAARTEIQNFDPENFRTAYPAVGWWGIQITPCFDRRSGYRPGKAS
jgi:hypothetical protein